MPLSSVIGADTIIKPGVCTSTTRPASPYDGQVIYETDTDLVQVWNGSEWKSIASTNGATFDSTGRMTNPVQPVFHVGKTNGDVSTITTILFNDLQINRGGCYSSATGRFTAPIAGLYHFYAKVMYNGVNPSGAVIKNQAGTVISQDYQDTRANYTGWQNSHMRVTVSMAVNNFVYVENSVAVTAYGTASHHTYFGGWLVA